jgi:hypothetical protein
MGLRTWGAIVCVAVLLGARPAGAEEERRVDLHGFGSWAYGNTDANGYLSGLPEGNYRNADFSLNVSGSVIERLRIVSQMGVQETQNGSEIALDYAFAEWRFSDRITLRAGKVKQPFGISAEVFHVGILRPFLALPQAVYGPSGLTTEAYEGVGFTGSLPLPQSWRLSYDVYGGGMTEIEFLAPEALLEGDPLEEDEPILEEELTKDVIGGRIVFETPVAGLRFGGSAHTGKEKAEAGLRRRSVAGAQAEYLTEKWSARTEYVHETIRDDTKLDGFYAEVAYRIDPHWQVASQYGRLTMKLLDIAVTANQSLLAHKELALGLNYWFSPEFVFKLAYHRVDGNRFAVPELEDLAALASSGQLRTKTNLVQFGVQFGF